MKTLFIRTVLAVVCLLAPAALMLRADPSAFVQFSVPFAFHAGAVELPAGTYEVSEYGNSGVLMIRGTGTPRSAMITAHPVNEVLAGSKSSATFLRHDGTYFLDTIQTSTGRVLGLTLVRK